ncbi:uncharacterized protein LOC133717099 [Rosa rugosa]|uniref:uncharacterized protein LOC133717099 n=1 Tax=Rosa rugosa TaxID=74645 RepID=UPI002B40D265|nr:uncharacterized protein LOC133717099 [Rosa rugosa]
MEARKPTAIGIDFGTTSSCVAVWDSRSNSVEVLPNEHGQKTTPSTVAFTESHRLVGVTADMEEELSRDSSSTIIWDVKRLLGRRFNEVQEDVKFPPKLVAGLGGVPLVALKHTGVQFSLEEISAMVLHKMYQIGKDYLGAQGKNVIITVPTHFNDMQRKATRDAATIAGLNVLQIVNESTAAAIAYAHSKKVSSSDQINLMVFNLGGGSFDVSIIKIENGNFKVEATAGDDLGATDFDGRLVDFLLKELIKDQKKDISGNPGALRRLQVACEKAKRTLSSTDAVTIVIDDLYEGVGFRKTITRAIFDQLNMELYQKLMELVNICFKDAHMDHSHVSDVVLIGDGSKNQCLRGLLQYYLQGTEICETLINSKEAVAYGAALIGAQSSGIDIGELQVVLCRQITTMPLSLELGKSKKQREMVFERKTAYPTMKQLTYTWPRKWHQDKISPWLVYEGSDHLLGEFQLEAIPKNISQIIITYSLDQNGILNVTAEGTSEHSGTKRMLLVNCSKRGLNGDIVSMMAAKLAREEQLKHAGGSNVEVQSFEDQKERHKVVKVSRVSNKVQMKLGTACKPSWFQ